MGGAELRKPGTDAVIITWGRWCALPRKLPNLLESEGLRTHILL